MKRTGILIFLLVLLSSCARKEFLEELEGKWKVTEINYIMDYTTQSQYPEDMTMHFTRTNYNTFTGDTLTQYGSFSVNPSVTKITFYDPLGINNFTIIEKTDIYQHWRKEKVIDGMYIEFKLDKIE